MKTELKKTFTSQEVDMISFISAILNEQVAAYQGEIAYWYIVRGNNEQAEIMLDFEKKEVGFVDCSLNIKDYFAIVGYSLQNGYTVDDYFYEK